MGNFFAELKRRHMYRVAAAYAVVAWVLLQLVNNIAPALRLPDWVATAIVMLLAIGFPVALLFSWIQHMAPADGAVHQAKTNRLDWILAGGLAAVIAIFLFQRLVPFDASTAPAKGGDTAKATSASPVGAISVAVLPFSNLSSDTEQEFFSDGMTEEITAALARVPGLMVIGRTSAFQFKGQNRDLRQIGQELGTTHLIEGSIRKAGNRVRIPAQLIRADNGAHLWAESYDRDLTDVFAIQENIAQAIAGSLSLPLGLHQGESLVGSRTTDQGAYEDYLRARSLLRTRGGRSQARLANSIETATLIESVLARDPNFAPAWGLLGLAHALSITSRPEYLGASSVEDGRRVVNDTFVRAEAAAQRAIQLDPNHADAYFTLARLQVGRGKMVQAEAMYLKGLTIDPSNPDGMLLYANLLGAVGRLKEALAMKQKVLALDPITGSGDNASIGRMLWLNGEIEAGIEKLKAVPPAVQDRAPYLAELYASTGRYREAADALMELPPGLYPPEMVRLASESLRRSPAVAADTPRLAPQGRYLNFIYLYVGATDRVLDWHERNLDLGWSTAVDISGLWHPSYAPVRKTERFKTYVRRTGLVEYWRAKGWPEFCHPATGDDFVCT